MFQDGFHIKTIVYLFRDFEGERQILLAKHRKQRKWNGFGGKVGDLEQFKNETIEEGAIREGTEELGIVVKNLIKRGVVNFVFYDSEGNPTLVQGHIFFSNAWDNEIKGLGMDEPTWFPFDKIPWHEMWPNDRVWLEPLINSDRFLEAEYHFGKESSDGSGAKQTVFVWKPMARSKSI